MKKIVKAASAAVIGIIFNVVGIYIAHVFKLPAWLDMTGTVIASYYGGIWGGIAAGLFGNLISAFCGWTYPIYSVTGVIPAVVIYLFIKNGYLNKVIKAVISSFWLGVICTVVSAPLDIIFSGGYSGNIWGDTLVDMLKWYDFSDITAALAGEAVVQIVDKQICVMIACLIIYTAERIKKGKHKDMQAAALIMAIAVSAFAIEPIEAGAEENGFFSDNFVEKIYNSANGMMSSEANVICETDDGYIWIGSYAGLTKYDGSEFEFVREGGLVNVVGMMTDSKGRLWIGTNDAGIARYENGAYRYFTEADGLPSNSVRCFAEGSDGSVYVGTSDKICRFSTDDKIEILEHDITFVTSMTVYNDMLVVLDNNGGVYALDGDKRLTLSGESADLFYYCLASTSDGLMLGTETGELFIADIVSDSIVPQKHIDIDAKKISAVFEDSKGRVWIASGSGFGYIAQDGEFRRMSVEDFDSSISYFHEDYQGNIWIASTSHGVMKLSESAFINAFEKIGAENQVVNAIARYKGNYFCGTDKGLIVFNENGLSNDFSELTAMTEGFRVRSILADSKDGLWLCTYSGLIYYASDGSIRCYTTETDSVTSDRFRCITELSDGTVAVGTADGINFIKDGNIIGTLTADDGLANTQILSIVEGSDGTVWAGSDGSGIYIISGGRLVKNYTDDNGLSSNVVLRIVPYGERYLIVTSNSLCCIEPNGEIRKLASFPYFNNYDIIIRDDTAYVTCSAGMYEIGIDELCADECGQPRLYSAGEGLFSGLTANSWNYVSEDGLLYLCGNNGVIIFNEIDDQTEANMKFGIVSLECDAYSFGPSGENSFIVPGNVRDLSVYASVRNYAFADIKVRFFVKEFDDNPKVYMWNEIEPIKIFKPDSSEYHICMQLLDSSGDRVL